MNRDVGTITHASRLFRKAGLKCDQATELTEIIEKMASEKIITRLETKIDANAELQKTKYNLLLWFIGVGVALIIASNFVGN